MCGVWVTPFAIRPVSKHALISRELVQDVERSLSKCNDGVDELDELAVHAAVVRFEHAQPALAARIQRLIRGSRDEAAVALGYFLMVGVYVAFERAFGSRLEQVTPPDLEAVFASLRLEAELRADRGSDPLEVEDVLAVQQPALFGWVAEHAESTLAASAELGDETVDVNDVDAVLSEVSAFILALSYAVSMPRGSHAVIGLA